MPAPPGPNPPPLIAKNQNRFSGFIAGSQMLCKELLGLCKGDGWLVGEENEQQGTM